MKEKKEKDWSGNGNSVFKTIGASNHTDKEREENDFYATHPKAIDALLAYDGFQLPKHIWEPSCGTGCLSKRLIEKGYDVFSSDLVDRGYGTGGMNFFEQASLPDENTECILTNPPYKFATDYVIHALSLLPKGGYLCLFLKTTFAEGQERFRRIFAFTPPHFGFAVRGTNTMRQKRRLLLYGRQRRQRAQLRLVDMAKGLQRQNDARLDQPQESTKHPTTNTFLTCQQHNQLSVSNS